MSQNRLSKSPTAEIVEKVNQLGLVAASKYFGVGAATLSRWLNAQNYKLKRIYVKEEQAS